MNKKIIVIFTLVLFLGAGISSVGVNSKISNYDPKVKNYKYSVIKNDELNVKCINIIDIIKPPLIIIDEKKLIEKSNTNDLKFIDLPEYFNWMDFEGEDWTTPAKDQGSCGSCWDFAAIGALESIIQIREKCAALSLDLSEQYVLSCLSHSGSCNGGRAYSAYKFIKLDNPYGNSCNGIIPEFCFPYQIKDNVKCENVSSNWTDFLIPITDYGHWFPGGSIDDRNAIKTRIFESGPVVAAMLFTIWNHGPNNLQEWGYIHNSPLEYYPYPGPVKSANHEVVIVGWKDDPSITNGGYWIIKNSLSEEWGYNGFFNLEYGSLNIENMEIIWVEYNPEDYSNWAPVAKINGPTQGNTNQEMIFNGSMSFDHEGTIVSYEWDFGDGTIKEGQTINHTYVQQGIYLLNLKVTDNANNTDDEKIWIYINKENHPPQKPTIKGNQQGKNETAYKYTISTDDPDGDEVKYYLNWGDDYWFGGSAGWIGPYTSGEEVTLDKIYNEKGNYTIRAKAQDIYGAKSDWAILEVSMAKTHYYNSIIQILMKMLEGFPMFERIINRII